VRHLLRWYWPGEWCHQWLHMKEELRVFFA
jgi:hypothetical protein